MGRPPMVADGGEITIMRRSANYVYGSWRVSLPEGEEFAAIEEGEAAGYLHYPRNNPTGRFDLAFVRMDASIDIKSIAPDGATSGDSDVELQMLAGQKRSEGRALIERDITTRGLGRLRPGVDFTTGDIWPVKIWGQVIDLPVTSLDWSTGEAGRAGWAVRVGGQLISDAEQLRSLNDQISEQIARERQERLAHQAQQNNENIKLAQQTAEAAKTAAEAAQQAADVAISNSETVIKAQQAADVARQGLQAAAEAAQQAADVAIANSETVIRAQEAEAVAREGLQTALESQQKSAALSQWRLLTDTDDYWTVAGGYATAKGDWVGRVIGISTTRATYDLSLSTDNYTDTGDVTIDKPWFLNMSVPTPSGTRRYGHCPVMLYQVDVGTQREWEDYKENRAPLVANKWAVVCGKFTAPTSGEYVLSFRVGWDACTYTDSYGIRVTNQAGTVLAQDGPYTKMGPLLPIGSGYRTQDIQTRINAVKGDVLSFEIYTSASGAARKVSWAKARMTWIER